MNKDKRVDAFIDQSKPFAQEILLHFRALVHKACPEVEETIKWGMPHFIYKEEVMCYMCAFTKHCAIGFRKAELMKDSEKLREGNSQAMGHYGKVASVKELPSTRIILANIKEAMMLNEKGIKLPPKKKVTLADIKVPEVLEQALKKNKKAAKTFYAFSPSHQKEYILWITEAKTEATRDKRLATAMEWLEEGKSRHWRYEKK